MFIAGIQSPAFASRNQPTPRFGMARLLKDGEGPGVDEKVLSICLPTPAVGLKPGKTAIPSRVALNREEQNQLSAIETQITAAQNAASSAGKPGNDKSHKRIEQLTEDRGNLLTLFLKDAQSSSKSSK